MLKDMTWRKLSRDVLSNANLQWVESQMAPELSAAPIMFYITALTIADDDGIFDLEDGIIFSRLMRIGTIKDVMRIANLMQKRRLIVRVSAESNKCYLVDWDYPKDKVQRSQADRRKRTLELIEEEKKRQKPAQFTNNDFEAADNQPIVFPEGDAPEDAISVDFANKPSSDVFLCPENDKKAENVDKEAHVDKNAKNVVNTEREIEREEKKETHTQAADFHGHRGPLQSLPTNTAVAGIETDETADAEKEVQRHIAAEQNKSDDIPESESQKGSDEKIDAELENNVFSTLNDFFVKNCYGYKPKQAKKAVDTIVQRCKELSNEANPPDIIASVLTKEFKKLVDTSEYYRGTPLLPSYMIKDGIWSHLLTAAGKILLTNKTRNEWDEQAKKYKEQAEKDRQAICDLFNTEYVKYGLDPDDPNRVAKLQQAKKEASVRK